MANITSIWETGSSSTRVDITFVAEGYLASELDKFLADALNFTNYIFSTDNAALNAPFSNYKSYFNVNALFLPSNESRWNLTSGVADTYFKANSYREDGRLMYGNYAAVHDAVSAALPYDAQDITIVLVNSQTYGGAGGSVIWVTSGNLSSAEILLHELGHTIADLGDEYVDHGISAPPLHSSLSYANITTSKSSPPWQAWLGYEDSLGKVDVYEGGYYQTTGVWRATEDSKMLSLGKAFNAPQKEAFGLAFYDIMGDYLTLDTRIPGFYFANVPDRNILSYTWSQDGAVLPNSGAYYLDLYAAGQYGAGSTVTLSTVDSTGMIRTNLSTTRQTEHATVQGSIVDLAGTTLEITQGGSVFRFDSADNTIIVRDSLTSAYFDGGDGLDTVVLDITRASVSLEKLASDSWLLLSSTAAPLMIFRNVEFVRFSDQTRVLNPTLSGTITSDTLQNSAGGEMIDGGAGTDFLVYSAPHAGFSIKQTGVGFTITDQASGSVDIVYNVERLVFNNLTVALDVAGVGGQVYSLYQVAFGRTPDSAGLAYWMSAVDQGMSLRNVSLSFTGSSEFKALYGTNSSNTQIVEQFYQNIMHRVGNADEVAYWLDVLDTGKDSVAGVLASLIESVEHQQLLATLVGNSFAYAPYG